MRRRTWCFAAAPVMGPGGEWGGGTALYPSSPRFLSAALEVHLWSGVVFLGLKCARTRRARPRGTMRPIAPRPQA